VLVVQSGQLGCVSTSWVSSLESSLSNRRQQLDIDRDPADIQPASVESASKPASASAYSEFCEAVPKEVLALQGLGISRVSAGMYHSGLSATNITSISLLSLVLRILLFFSVALRENGQLYSFGKNKQGQLGLGRSSTDSVDETLPAQEKIEARIVGTEWEIDEESVNMPFLVRLHFCVFGDCGIVSDKFFIDTTGGLVRLTESSFSRCVRTAFSGDCCGIGAFYSTSSTEFHWGLHRFAGASSVSIVASSARMLQKPTFKLNGICHFEF
jgi:hypothetical protein